MQHSCLLSIHWENDQRPQVAVMGELTDAVIEEIVRAHEIRKQRVDNSVANFNGKRTILGS